MNPTLSLYVAVSIRMAIVIAAWMLLRLVLRNRIPTRFIVAGWALIFVSLLLPLRWSTPASPFNLLPSPMREESIEEPESTDLELSEPDSVLVTAVATRPVARMATTATHPKSAAAPAVARPAARFNWRTFAFCAWFVGVAVFIVARIRQWRQHRRMLDHCASLEESRLNDVVADAARDLGISGPIRVLTIDSNETPAVFGFTQPTLVFPTGFAERLSSAELYLVIMHELGHWRRRDLWMHELAYLARALHWFNPMVWLAVAWLREDSESACDEFVMRRMTPAETSNYGSLLLKVLGLVRDKPASPVGIGFFGSKQKLQQRIRMIARYARPNARHILLGSFAVAALLATCLTKELRAQEPAAPAPAPNPAGRITTEAPPGWMRNGKNAQNYTVGVDFTQPYGLPGSAYVKSNSPATAGDFGGMMQSIDAAGYVGKRLRFSAWMKSQDAEKGAQIWMRVDGVRQGTQPPTMQFDNMDFRPHPKGTTGWQHCEVVLDVPQGAVGIYFGFFVKGDGQAWVNDAKLEEVGQDVPSTDMKSAPQPPPPPKPAQPQNLAFTPGT